MIFVHVSAILCTAFLVVYSDEQGLKWMLGKKETLPAKQMRWLHILVSGGLVVTILSGAIMASASLEYYLSNPVFLVKMAFVGVLVVNAFFIGALLPIASTRAFSSLSSREKVPLLLSGALSGMCWVGAIACGLSLSGWW